jgi:hypothetical protein
VTGLSRDYLRASLKPWVLSLFTIAYDSIASTVDILQRLGVLVLSILILPFCSLG